MGNRPNQFNPDRPLAAGLHSLTRRAFLKAAGATAAAATVQQPFRRVHAANRPNILLLVSDDHRWDALGYAGNPIVRTPNIDRLAERGTRFVNGFCTTAICCASRASIFTGLYSSTHAIEDFNLPMPPALFARSYPALLREAGYRTGFIGKWGLGGDLPADAFDYFKGFPGQGAYFNEIDGKTLHMTQLIEDQALEFLQTSTSDQPFCLSVSFKAPHVQDNDPRQFLYDPQYESLYQDVTIPPPPASDPNHFASLPPYVRESEGRKRWDRRFSTPDLYQQMVKGYYRLVTGMDAAVGRILEAFEQNGALDNTVILFTSDNGFFLGEHGMAGKWLMYEESIRVPMIIVDPRLSPDYRAARRSEPVLNIDVAPTLLEWAEVTVPETMQGRSLLPLIETGDVPWRQEWFYEHHFGNDRPAPIPAVEGVHTGRWKYVRYVQREPLREEIYDLESDPHEVNNLAAVKEHFDRLEDLRHRWAIWRDSLKPWNETQDTPWSEPR